MPIARESAIGDPSRIGRRDKHISSGGLVDSVRPAVPFHISASPPVLPPLVRDAVRLCVIMGTRPEVIKLARVVHVLREIPAFDVRVCAIHQQTAILEAALAEWALIPDARLYLDRENPGVAASLAAAITAVSHYLAEARPDLVLVQGDTTTALAAALAAFYAGIPVAHVEAGLRSRDATDPFPEETHRILIDELASIHYAPTERARQNLYDDGHHNGSVAVVGNTVVDALMHMRERVQISGQLSESGRRMLLVTAHRRESFGAGIAAICDAVRAVVRSRYDVEVVYVLHPNPEASDTARGMLMGEDRVELIEPQGYEQFVRLMDRAYLIVTDSGGIQEEAPYLGKPVLVTRERTERPEASDLGLARIVGTHSAGIQAAIFELLDDEAAYRAMIGEVQPFGDGGSALRIRMDIARRLGVRIMA